MTKEFLTIKEASDYTGSSINTVKRFITTYKNQFPEDFGDYTTGNNYPSTKISKSIIDTHFDRRTDGQTDTRTDTSKTKTSSHEEEYINDNKKNKQTSTETDGQTDRQIHGQTNEKYRADIIRVKELELLDTLQDKATLQAKTPILRHSTFWTAIVSIIIIIALLSAGYYYREEILSIYNGKINDLKQNHSKQIESREKELSNQQERYKELKDQYNIMITEIKSSHQKLTSSQEKQITDLSSKLKELNKGLKEAETAHTMALKNTDVLHIKYNDKIEQLEEKVKSLEKGDKTDSNPKQATMPEGKN